MARRVRLFRFSNRGLRVHLLDASDREVAFEPLLEHSGGRPGDDPLPRWFGGYDPGFPQLRWEAGTSIPRGNSLGRCRHRPDIAGRRQFSLALNNALVARLHGDCRRQRPVIRTSGRHAGGSRRSHGYRVDHFDRFTWRVRGPLLVGAVASGSGGIYRGLAIAGISFFMCAALVLRLPKNARQASAGQTP